MVAGPTAAPSPLADDLAAMLAGHFPAKVRCAHGYESWALQLRLDALLGCNFGMGLPVPWQPGAKLLLVVQRRHNGGWFLSWATSQDFETSPLPEISASELLELASGPVPPNRTAIRPRTGAA